MPHHRGDVDLGYVVDADRGGGADKGDRGREIGEAAAVEILVGGEGGDAAGRAVYRHAAARADRVALDAELELIVAIVGETHRAVGREQAGQGDVELVDGVVLAAEGAAHIGAMRDDLADRLVGGILRDERRHAGGRLLRRLHADHELELARTAVVPGKPGLRLHEHLVDRLGLERAIEHETVGTGRVDLGADLVAVEGGLLASEPVADGTAHCGRSSFLIEGRKGPSGEHRRIDVLGLRSRAGNAHEARRRVRLLGERAGLRAEAQHALGELERRLASAKRAKSFQISSATG